MNLIKNIFFGFLFPVGMVIIYYLCKTNKSLDAKLGGLSDLIPFLIALLTYYYVIFTARSVQIMVDVLRQERRPYIVVDFEFIDKEVYLVLKNIGKLPAEKLRVTLVPDLLTVLNENLAESLFSNPILFFPPGKEFRSFVNFSEEILKEGSPQSTNCTLKYSWKGNRKDNEENYLINFDHHKKCTVIKNSKKEENQNNETLEKIEKNLELLIKYLYKNSDRTGHPRP